MTRGRRRLGRKAVSVAVHSTLGHALTTIWNLVADMAFCCQFGIIYLAILVKYISQGSHKIRLVCCLSLCGKNVEAAVCTHAHESCYFFMQRTGNASAGTTA